jgi:hypothetical protein
VSVSRAPSQPRSSTWAVSRLRSVAWAPCWRRPMATPARSSRPKRRQSRAPRPRSSAPQPPTSNGTSRHLTRVNDRRSRARSDARRQTPRRQMPPCARPTIDVCSAERLALCERPPPRSTAGKRRSTSTRIPAPSGCERARLAELARINLAPQPTSRGRSDIGLSSLLASDTSTVSRPVPRELPGPGATSSSLPPRPRMTSRPPRLVSRCLERVRLRTAQVLRRARVGSSMRRAPRRTARSRGVRSASRTRRWPLTVLPTAAVMLVLAELGLLLVPRIV